METTTAPPMPSDFLGAGTSQTHSHLDRSVRDVMTPGVITMVEEASLRTVFRAMAVHRVHAVLVVGRNVGRPLGWITARGLLDFLDRDPQLIRARDAITEGPEAIAPSATVREALARLARPGVSHLLVSHDSRLMPEGVISDADLVRLGGC